MKSESVEFVVFLVGILRVWTVSSLEQADDKQCGQIFFQDNFQGHLLAINDEERISDLSDLRYHYGGGGGGLGQENNEGSGPSFSFRVKPGCTLQLSPTKYLQDDLWAFTEDDPEMKRFTPNSVSCSCPKICSCEDTRLRRSECGRAYLGGDCTNCKAVFTSLKSGGWMSFPVAWSPHVKSVILRTGCDLTLKHDLAGNQVQKLSSTSSRVTHNIEPSWNLTEYLCECSEYVVPPAEPPNPSNPTLIDIPKSKGSINTLLFNNELKSHPGLMAALQSIRTKRSSRNAYILLLGMTGSGKSSAVNLLFDHPNITKTGDFVSTTSDILEFTIPVPVPQLGMKNTGLHVIDTPGIGDTRGILEDARFLASLDDFLNKHEDLRRNLPNVVLIFAKFSDNRFSGEGSGFVKMLRTLDLFKDKIIDRKSTNVIFVLSHFMSETKSVTKDPSEKISAIRRVIQEFSTLPRPIHIVLAENKPEENMLLSVNGFYALPNGDFYPKNLFDQMHRSLTGDPVGDAVIQTAFSNSDNFQISSKRHRLLHKNNAKVTKYLGSLAAFNLPVSGTEVASALNQAYDLLDPSLKTAYPDALNTLQRSLYLRNIFLKSDLPTTTQETIQLLENLHLNPLTLTLLKSALNLTVPEFKADFVVGSGYSLISDSVLPSKIVQIDNIPEQPTDILFRMPDCYQVQPVSQMVNVFQVFQTKNDLVQGRMAALGLQKDSVSSSSYDAPVTQHAGFNLVPLSDASQGETLNWNSISAALEYHTFQIALGGNAKLSQEFSAVVGQLEKVNLTDPVNVQSWRSFFDRFGTHLVTNSFGGGSVRVEASFHADEFQTSVSNADKFGILSEAMGKIMEELANELIGKDAKYSPPAGVSYKFSQVGGQRQHFWSNFSDLDHPKSIDDWKDTLKYEPEVLTSQLQLVPISEVVKKMDAITDKGYLIEEAAEALFNASLVYIPMWNSAQDGNEAESRERLSSSVGHRQASGDFESMQEMASVFQMITQSNKQMQDDIARMMAESQQKQQEQEAQWQREMLALKQQEAEAERQRKLDERYDREMEFKREEMRLQREAQENVARMQMEQARMQMEAQQRLQMEEIRSRNEQNLMQFINAENNRQTQIALSQKGWFDKLLDKFDSHSQNAMQMLPMLMMAGG